MYTLVRIIVIFFRAHLFVLAPLSETSDGVGTIRPLGSRCRRFGRDPCNVSRVASLQGFLGLGMDKINPWVSLGLRNIPGDWVSASPLPVYARKNWTQTGFSWLRVHGHFPIFAQRTTLRSCRPSAVQSPSSSSLQLYARVAAVLVADCVDWSVPVVTSPYPTFLLCCRCVRMSIACP